MFRKTRRNINIKAFLVVIVGFWLLNSILFSVDETQTAVILKFGKPVKEYLTPGLKIKWPWPFNSAVFVEKRYFLYDSDPKEIITKDKKILVVDDFAPCRITSPTKFLQQTQTISGAQERIDDIIYSHLRNSMGKAELDLIVVEKREEILDEITERTNNSLKEYALETAMVRANRVDLPNENKQAVYRRMKAERERQAKLYRSEGEEENMRIKAETNKEKDQILAEADREQKRIRGGADARATKIYNEAYGKDTYFFNLYLSLQTAQETMRNSKNKKIILSGNEPHLKELFK